MKDFNIDEQDISIIFSGLESDIMNIAWMRGEVSTNLLYKLLGEKHDVAHSTISVTLNRLYSKGVFERRPEKGLGGTKFIYAPILTKQEFGNKIADKFMIFLRKNFGENCIANLKKEITK